MMSAFIKLFFGVLFLLLISGCNESADGLSCENIAPANPNNLSFFTGVNVPLFEIGQSDNKLGIACHNCYDDNSNSPESSIKFIDEAIQSYVALIEIDIIGTNDNNFIPYISHEEGIEKLTLQDLLFEPVLSSASQPLFIEIKGKLHNKDNIRILLNIIKKIPSEESDYAYFNESRFTVFRNMEDYLTLALIREVLEENEFITIKNHVKFSKMFYPKPQKEMLDEVQKVYQCGFHMIELDTRIGVDNINFTYSMAKSLGLAVNVFTINKNNYESLIPELKYSVDVFTIEGTTRDSAAYSESNLFDRIKILLN